MSRILVIGFDGATLDLMQPWADEGKLPTLARMMKEGSYGKMRSTIPALSPPAWISFATGKNPGKHGLFDFLARYPDSYKLKSMRYNPYNAVSIFKLLSDAGKRVGVVNIPLIYPPEKIDGVMISGLGAPSDGMYVHPSDLLPELQKMGYRIYPKVTYIPGKNEDAYITEMFELIDLRAEVAKKLLRQEMWDLFMVVFRATDDSQSFLWHHFDSQHPQNDSSISPRYASTIFDVYKRLDEIAAELIEISGEEVTVFVMSDHGGGPVYKEVYLNNWLAEQGFLTFKSTDIVAQSRGNLLRKVGLTQDNLSRLLPTGIREYLRKNLPEQWQILVPKNHHISLADVVDWTRTKAYSFGYIGQIYINLQGREPQGIVTSAEYEDFIEELIVALRRWCDPETSKLVVDEIYRKDEIYHGTNAKRGPDLCLIMQGMSYITRMGTEVGRTTIFGEPGESGTHRLEGVFLIQGPAINRGNLMEGVTITDLAPTILYLMGLDVPSDMDGKILTEAITPSFKKLHPTQYTIGESFYTNVPPLSEEPWTDEDEAEIIEHLKDLGYIN